MPPRIPAALSYPLEGSSFFCQGLWFPEEADRGQPRGGGKTRYLLLVSSLCGVPLSLGPPAPKLVCFTENENERKEVGTLCHLVMPVFPLDIMNVLHSGSKVHRITKETNGIKI